MDAEFFCRHSDICKTLANDKRQMILASLRDGERTVSDIVDVTGMSQANVSQHLARMRAADVVSMRREGAFVYYRLANPKLIQAFDLITEVMMEADQRRLSRPDGEEE